MGCATFAGNYNYLARVACNTLGRGPYDYHWHAGPEALTVKTTVPTPCTPPFRKNQQAKRPLTGAWFGGCQPMPAQSKLNDLRRDGSAPGPVLGFRTSPI